MPTTYEPIATNTLSSAAVSVTFSSIPATYTDLVLVFNGKSAQTGSSVNGFRCRLNSDTGTNYSNTFLEGNGSAASSFRETGNDFMNISYISQTSASLGNVIANFNNYSNTTTYKTIVARGNNPSVITNATVGLWRNTAAISTILLYRDLTNNIEAGSTFTLYGIKAA